MVIVVLQITKCKMVAFDIHMYEPEEVGQGHVHKISNCGVGQRKLTD